MALHDPDWRTRKGIHTHPLKQDSVMGCLFRYSVL